MMQVLSAAFYRERLEVREVYSESGLAESQTVPVRLGWSSTQTSQSPRPVLFILPHCIPTFPLENETLVSFLIQNGHLSSVFMRTANNIPITVTLFR